MKPENVLEPNKSLENKCGIQSQIAGKIKKACLPQDFSATFKIRVASSPTKPDQCWKTKDRMFVIF